MKRSGKILLEGTIEEFKKHCKGADNREYLLINTKEIKKDGTYTIYQLDSNTERVTSISAKGKYGKLSFIPYNKLYLTFVALSDGTFKFRGSSNNQIVNTIQYSTNNGDTWSKATQDVEINVQNGDKVLWKGEMTPISVSPPTSWGGVGYFETSTATFDIEGNIMSLLYGDNFVGQVDLSGRDYAFRNLFQNTKCINADNFVLPATTLADYCYQNMFFGCTSLTTAPQLPATTLADSCYQYMFSGCTSLTTAPELPATTLADSCYRCMFQGCTSLTTAPSLPAIILTNSCYSSMFSGCTNLNNITMLATDISASNCLQSWVSNVAASGTFTKAASMASLPTGSNGIPSGWTVEDATE